MVSTNLFEPLLTSDDGGDEGGEMTVPLGRLLPVGLEGGRVEGEGDVLLGDAAGVDRHARVVVSVLLLQVDHRQVEPSLLTT
jgi:hypothetical protein